MNTPVKVSVIEDDGKYHQIIHGYLQEYGKKKGIEFHVQDYSDGLGFLEEYKGDADVLFMDIERPQRDGLEVCRKLRKIDPYVPIIIVSHSAQYAVKGYEVNALGYVVKPIVRFDFFFLLDKVRERRKDKEQHYLVLSNKSTVKKISLDDILYLEVSSHTIKVRRKKETIEFRGKIKDYEDRLCRYSFFRCNNSFLVNLKYCDKVSVGDSTIDRGGTIISISRPKKKQFLETLADYLKDEI